MLYAVIYGGRDLWGLYSDDTGTYKLLSRLAL